MQISAQTNSWNYWIKDWTLCSKKNLNIRFQFYFKNFFQKTTTSFTSTVAAIFAKSSPMEKAFLGIKLTSNNLGPKLQIFHGCWQLVLKLRSIICRHICEDRKFYRVLSVWWFSSDLVFERSDFKVTLQLLFMFLRDDWWKKFIGVKNLTF